MKYSLRLLLCLLGIGMFPTLVWAVQFVTPVQGDQEVPIDLSQPGYWHFGTLNQHPHPYMFTVTEEVEVIFSVMVPNGETPVLDIGAIIVRKAQRGVEEVARLPAPPRESWELFRDWRTADSYLVGPHYQAILKPGVYILEINSPENIGRYVLRYGKGNNFDHLSYVEKVRHMLQIKEFHDKSAFWIIVSPYVFAPPLVVIVSLGLWYYMRVRRKKEHA